MRGNAGIADAYRAAPRPAHLGRRAVGSGNVVERQKSKVQSPRSRDFRLSTFDLAAPCRTRPLSGGGGGTKTAFGTRRNRRHLAGGSGSCDAFFAFTYPIGRFSGCSPSVMFLPLSSFILAIRAAGI